MSIKSNKTNQLKLNSHSDNKLFDQYFKKDNKEGAIRISQNQQIELNAIHDEHNLEEMTNSQISEMYLHQDQTKLKNKQRSNFFFFIPLCKQGSKYLIAIQKNHIHWNLLKLLVFWIIIHFMIVFVQNSKKPYQWVKNLLYYSLVIQPYYYIIVAILDPGYLLSSQIPQNQVKSTISQIPSKYCKVCNIFTSGYSGHCYRCQHCVSGFDHHCSIMVRCVGYTNMIPFYLFVMSWNIFYSGIIVVAVWQIFF